VVPCRGWPGGHSLFFAPPKKSKPKKGGRKTLAFGFPLLQRQNRETKRTRCAQTPSFLIRFRHRISGSVPSGFQVKSNFNGNFKNNCNCNCNCNYNYNCKFKSTLGGRWDGA